LFLIAWSLLSCTGTDGARPPGGVSARPPAPSLDPAKRAEIERDLVVVLARVGQGTGDLDGDADWPITATLMNRGMHAHWVVASNDGSGEGWREPNVYYTAEMETTPGVWRPVPRRDDYMRCGNYATDWYSDAAELAAGASMELGHFVDPSRLLDFPRSGRIRLYAHYDYEGGAKRSRSFSVPASTLPEELEAGGPFALISAPLEVRVHVDTSIELPLVLRRRQLHVNERVTLDALVDAQIVSHAAARIDLGDDSLDYRFHLEVKGDIDGPWYLHALAGPEQIDPYQRVSLRSAPREQDLASDQPGTMRLRLRYDGRRRYRSPWLALPVVP